MGINYENLRAPCVPGDAVKTIFAKVDSISCISLPPRLSWRFSQRPIASKLHAVTNQHACKYNLLLPISNPMSIVYGIL
jgi:hypothetical protein